MVQKINLIIFMVFVAINCVHSFLNLRSDFKNYWLSYKSLYRKNYESQLEDFARRMIWQNNLLKIQKHNIEFDLGLHTYTMGVNQFTDLTFEEYSKFLNPMNYSKEFNKGSTYLKPINSYQLPSQVDWRTQGYVTPVKNQGQCGSCWSFSATGALEGQHFRSTKQLVSLSEQNLVDCSQSYGNAGCNGGWPFQAFQYIKGNGGIDTESSYPYEAVDGKCRFSSQNIGATCAGFHKIPPSEAELQDAVANQGPISVCIDASHSSFQSYQSGVYNEPACTSMIDHAVLVVGYGTENGQDYWLVKNSWGAAWGMNGYIKMSRNRNNQCAIASYGVYPLV